MWNPSTSGPAPRLTSSSSTTPPLLLLLLLLLPLLWHQAAAATAAAVHASQCMGHRVSLVALCLDFWRSRERALWPKEAGMVTFCGCASTQGSVRSRSSHSRYNSSVYSGCTACIATPFGFLCLGSFQLLKKCPGRLSPRPTFLPTTSLSWDAVIAPSSAAAGRGNHSRSVSPLHTSQINSKHTQKAAERPGCPTSHALQ
jgi:hypothetical protein